MSNVVSLFEQRVNRATDATLADLECIREQLLDLYAGTPEGTPFNAAATCLLTLADRLVAIALNEIR